MRVSAWVSKSLPLTGKEEKAEKQAEAALRSVTVPGGRHRGGAGGVGARMGAPLLCRIVRAPQTCFLSDI